MDEKLSAEVFNLKYNDLIFCIPLTQEAIRRDKLRAISGPVNEKI